MTEATTTGPRGKVRDLLYRMLRRTELDGLFKPNADPSLNDKLRRMLGKLILIRVAVLSIILGVTGWELLTAGAGPEPRSVTFWSFALIYGVSAANALLLRRVQRLALFAYVQLSVDVILATLAIYVTNSAVSIFLYLLVIVAAALVSSRKGAVVIAALSGICYALLMSGVLPPLSGHRSDANPLDILFVYLSMVAIALVSGYVARQLEEMGSLADSTARDLVHLSEQQRKVFDDMSEGIITMDLSSTITGLNQAARSILGLSELEASHFVGRMLPDMLRQRGLADAEKLMKSAEDTSAALTLKKPDSPEEIHLDYSVRTLSDKTGSENAKLFIFSDVSHVKSMEERLHLHERMTKLLADTSPTNVITSVRHQFSQITGDSPIMRRVYALVERVAASEASVLINGESGTGKELIAKAIHAHGSRHNQPFVAINCGAIPENLIESELFGHKKGSFTGAVNDNPGLFRQAHGGTIFLDEIGELPLQMQTKLLRVLQERTIRPVGDVRDYPVDARVIAATNRDLKKEIQAGRFREDLFYRLNVVNIMVPPLRDRREDIPLLVRHFIGQLCSSDQPLPQVSPEALQLLMSYGFPGNIRELENIVERALVLGGQAILPEHLPEEVLSAAKRDSRPDTHTRMTEETKIILLPIDLERELETLERQYLFMALEQSGGVKKHAAELLGLNFRSFRYRLKKYGLADSAMGDE
ncbi:MAG: sigma 54-interacting transcriptional regulator [Bdellovibrionota bacterium]